MRASRLNLTTSPQLFYSHDKGRSLFIFRNTDVAIITRVQFGAPSTSRDGFEILPGDTLALDRGDLTGEIYLWADTAHSNNQCLVG